MVEEDKAIIISEDGQRARGKNRRSQRCFNGESMAKGVQLSSGLFYNKE